MFKSLTKPFLLLLVFLVIVASYLVFKPFLIELFVAIILASIFYRPYEKLTAWLKGKRNLAALLMCLFLVLVILVPTVRIIVYAGQKSVSAYSQVVTFFNENDIHEIIRNNSILEQGVFKYLKLGETFKENQLFKDFFLDVFKKSSNWVLSGASSVLKGTTNFVVSLVMIIIAMFFFFVDGKNMLKRAMRLSPLPDRYDQEIFAKFKSVSYTIFISTFVTAGAQGLVGAIGFAIVGFPALLAGIVVSLLSLLPYLGSMIFYVPMGLYYLLIGQVWQGIFVLAWGFFIIGTIDNIIRAYMIKDKAQVNPGLVLFSILGGISLFGFWGVALGPLIIALTATIFYIYELEFKPELDLNLRENRMSDIREIKRNSEIKENKIK